MKFTTQWHFGNNVCELTPLKIEDQRGFFSEVYQKNDFEKLGIMENFMQENHSFTRDKHTFRGLHLQKPPFEQAKLVRVLKGSILDIALDLRQESATYLQHKKFTLTENNFKQLFIPAGFAHGFLTLEDNCEISYKVSNPYNHPSDVSLSVFDKKLGITLPCSKEDIALSKKDDDALELDALGKIF